MTEPVTEIEIYVDGMAPIELACPLDSPVLKNLCVCWANKSDYGDQVMSLEIGADESSTVYFPISAIRGLKSSLPLPDELFLDHTAWKGKDFSHLDIHPEWIEWVKANLAHGAPREKIYRVMLDKGVDPHAIGELLDYDPAEPLDITEREDRESIEPLLGQGIDQDQRFQSDYIELYVLDKFLGEDMCSFFESCVKGEGKKSIIYGENPISDIRTSRHYTLPNTEGTDLRVRKFQDRLLELLDTKEHLMEPVSCVVYEESQQFKAHADYYEDEVSWYESRDGTRRCGPRQWSVVIYLQDSEPGSGTRFHRLRQDFNPGKGTALIWNNLYPSGRPNHYTHHCGLPVTSGRKVIVLQMIRQDTGEV